MAQTHEFDVQVGDTVFPTTVIGDIDFDSSSHGNDDSSLNDLQLSLMRSSSVLDPFQIEGPIDLYIEDGVDTRVIMPDDTTFGGLRHLLLSEGIKITVEGAREVSLAHPIDFASLVGMNMSSSGLQGLMPSEIRQTVTLRIIGPSLIAVANLVETQDHVEAILFAPNALELCKKRLPELSSVLFPLNSGQKKWPLPTLYGSDMQMLLLERLLIRIVGQKAFNEGSFRIIKAVVTASTYVQINLKLERKLNNNNFDSDGWPSWKTRPAVQRLHFKVIAKVESKKLKPILIKKLKSVVTVETRSWSDFMSNVTFSSLPSPLIPSGPLTLDVNW
eukprot:TRINITY_DN22119_c0_g1_i1.p1 TRINITY_DN22119_c0_g1~~TRINITY_DN22119_c0_g1_i1.p1  ORF type:complete len:377 (-),score=49.20 TRINITY_DN22119_c0_g1_i1:144-1136(-)